MFVAKLIQQVFIHTKKLYFLKKNNSLIWNRLVFRYNHMRSLQSKRIRNKFLSKIEIIKIEIN